MKVQQIFIFDSINTKRQQSTGVSPLETYSQKNALEQNFTVTYFE